MRNLVKTGLLLILIISCSTTNETIPPEVVLPVNSPTINYLALGDSYTIGQSVCETCRFPIQLQYSLKKNS